MFDSSERKQSRAASYLRAHYDDDSEEVEFDA